MFFLATLLVLGASGDERLLTNEVSAGVGVLGSGYSQLGVRLADAQLTPTVTARWLFWGVTVDGGLLLVAPLTRDGAALALTGGLRVGYTGQRFSVVGGALAQWASDGHPAVQWLPTLRASVDFGPFGLTLGILDELGLLPAHLSFDLALGRSTFSVGWVAPIGLVGRFEVPLVSDFALRLQGFAYKVAEAEFAQVMVGVVFTPGAGSKEGAR